VLAGRIPRLPPLDRVAQGCLVRLLPTSVQAPLVAASGGLIAIQRTRRIRRHVDLGMGLEAWQATIEPHVRSTIRACENRIAAVSGDSIAIQRCDTADEVTRFHDDAARIDVRIHHARLGRSLPEDPAFLRHMANLAESGALRAWVLVIAGEPAAYLYCEVANGIVVNLHDAADPAFAEWQRGAVLQWHALRALFAEGGLRHFDFHDRDGECARWFATGAVPCVDLALLRASLANRVSALVANGLGQIGAVAGRLGRKRHADVTGPDA
jgi:hypothetical protein